jgi:hypothetical protein
MTREQAGARARLQLLHQLGALLLRDVRVQQRQVRRVALAVTQAERAPRGRGGALYLLVRVHQHEHALEPRGGLRYAVEAQLVRLPAGTPRVSAAGFTAGVYVCSRCARP